jgi:hypothetical protein
MNEQKPLPSKAATDAGLKFAMDALERIPKDDPEALEAHITGVLVLFWGALWGSFGTEYASGFIEAQLRGMEPDQRHDVFTRPRMQ